MDKGIWKFAERLLPNISVNFRLTLDEGNTRLQEIKGLYFKREDENPTGSVKDRGMAYQISAWLQKLSTSEVENKNFWIRSSPGVVISSSGNAAASAVAYCKLARLKLNVFVSNKISFKKLNRLKAKLPPPSSGQRPVSAESLALKMVPNPVSSAHRYAKEKGLYNLRPSKDEFGSVGYKTIGYELQGQLPKVGSIFFPTSSGTTLLGVGNSFDNTFPQLHTVQTTKTNAIARRFDQDFEPSKTSLASALVAKSVPRKAEVISLINQSEGSGWVVDDKQIKSADKWLKGHGVKTSFEGVAALAGYFKAKDKNFKVKEPVVIMLTGSL